ncbi:hypothetical protein JXB28_00110 [Candidatus Woesearchaeota archaeon]|nr:hypothetical protein [Candidatus Woesearchaeota archaeon]
MRKRGSKYQSKAKVRETQARKVQASKAQVSMEFLMIIGIALMMTFPLIIIFFQQQENVQTEIGASQIDKVASEIRDAADEVYYLGAPSKKTVTVYMPEGVKSISITSNKMVFEVEAPGNDYELVKWSVANLTGALQDYSGVHHVSVQSNSDGTVTITD